VSALSPKLDICSDQAQLDADVARNKAQGAVTLPSWSIASVTAEAKHIERMARAAEPAAADDATRVVSQDTPSHRADAGMAWGTLIHGLLEHAMRYKGATAADLKRLALWLTVEEPQLRPLIDDAIAVVQSAKAASFWVDALSGEHLVEVPFFVRQSDQEAVLRNGVVDLLFSTESGWHLRDYKTDITLDSNSYADQLAAYRDALERLGCSVVDASTIHMRQPQ
jgi:ATP-dependent exoDNAse (exonuclease V) beta subunit